MPVKLIPISPEIHSSGGRRGPVQQVPAIPSLDTARVLSTQAPPIPSSGATPVSPIRQAVAIPSLETTPGGTPQAGHKIPLSDYLPDKPIRREAAIRSSAQMPAPAESSISPTLLRLATQRRSRK